MLIVLAALAMVVDDVLAVMLVQAEARNRAVLSGILDSFMWMFSMLVTVTTVNVMQGHHFEKKAVAVGAITLANFVGSMAGVRIGRRYIKQDRDQ